MSRSRELVANKSIFFRLRDFNDICLELLRANTNTQECKIKTQSKLRIKHSISKDVLCLEPSFDLPSGRIKRCYHPIKYNFHFKKYFLINIF